MPGAFTPRGLQDHLAPRVRTSQTLEVTRFEVFGDETRGADYVLQLQLIFSILEPLLYLQNFRACGLKGYLLQPGGQHSPPAPNCWPHTLGE